MNERIHELIKEATEFQKIPYDGIDGVYREAFVFNKENFDELIVRECVSIAHPQLKDVGEWAAGMRLAQKRIKEHFGVKE
jgi:hypothetical protein